MFFFKWFRHTQCFLFKSTDNWIIPLYNPRDVGHDFIAIAISFSEYNLVIINFLPPRSILFNSGKFNLLVKF